MSGLPWLRCAGAPRDLGLDQGQALREPVRAALGTAARGPSPLRWLRDRLRGGRATSAWRDLQSYFPHHAERMLGLSLGAGVPARALVGRLADLLEGDGGLAAAISPERAERALLARSFGPGLEGAQLVVRQSAPDNDYQSLELAPVWSAASAIGVNERGLAATASVLPAPDALLAGCAAPALLLVQDVLQRFDAVEKAVEWAVRRPAGGRASLLLADASGRVAAVGIAGRERRVFGEAEAWRIGFGPASAVAVLQKGLASAHRIDVTSLAHLLGAASARPALVALADPLGRRLGVARGEAALHWHELS